MARRINSGSSSDSYYDPWWKADLTDVRKLILLMKGDDSEIRISDREFDYDDLDDLVRNSPRVINYLSITESDSVGRVHVYFDTDVIRMNFSPENHPRRIQISEFMNSRIIKIPAMGLLLQIPIGLGITLVFVAVIGYFLRAIFAATPSTLIYVLSGVFVVFLFSNFLQRIKKWYCVVSLVEKNARKGHWEKWGEKLFYAFLGVILSGIGQLIVKHISKP